MWAILAGETGHPPTAHRPQGAKLAEPVGGFPSDPRDERLMGAALAAAKRAAQAGEIPVGAVIVDASGEILAEGWNDREASLDPTGHAEVIAIRRAAQAIGDRLLEGCTLVVTLEPCVMCAGVIAAARIPRVVFGAWDEKAGACGSVYDVLRDRRLPHPPVEVVSDVRAAECAALLAEFFQARR